MPLPIQAPMGRPMRSPMPGMPTKPGMAAARPGGMKKGGATHRCHDRADGCAEKGHTKGKIVMCGGGKV